jgi:hypothetical protein
MKYDSLCKRCEQASSGCGFALQAEGEGRELQDWEVAALATSVCPHALCLDGRGIISGVLYGKRHPHKINYDGKLVFAFRGKTIPFIVDPTSRTITQESSGVLIPIGVKV